MIKNDDKKTSPKQRIVICAIAFFMLAATFMLYIGIVLNYQNQESKQQTATEKQQRLSELMQEHQAEVDALAQDLSGKYFDDFVGYKDRVKSFNAADITELKKKDLKEGDGETIEDGNKNVDYSAYYIGWLSDGTIFDSSLNSTSNPTSLKFPLEGSTSMIQGWLDGISGMKIGGVRELSIPAVLAYGETANGTIPANSPLKFIVMLVPKQEEPDYSEEFYKLYYGDAYTSTEKSEESSEGESSTTEE